MDRVKEKSAAKLVLTQRDGLESIVLRTMDIVSTVVGGTLGPGGCPVLIERHEWGLPSSITKDGVTVFRSLGFQDSAQHCIMEAARDAASRTGDEAGDGTTTATVLSESIVRHISNYVKDHPTESPQYIVRHLEKVFRETIEPKIKELSISVELGKDDEIIRNIAKLSANGDDELAGAVMECFDITGDDGNVTITETSGPSGYEVEEVVGFPVAMGYEKSCSKFSSEFVNDSDNQQCVLEDPLFLVYFGKIVDIQKIVPLMDKVYKKWHDGTSKFRNVVIVATGFSEGVLASLAHNFKAQNTINVFPLLTPMTPIANGQLHFLEDLAAVTNTVVYDELQGSLDTLEVEDLGNCEVEETDEAGAVLVPEGVELFESSRFRSSIVGIANEDEALLRADTISGMLKNPESILDKTILEERLAAITGGIARLRVVGASTGELREKRDRAEDAVCAVRGALCHGYLYGGGWGLLSVLSHLNKTYRDDPVVKNILGPALRSPVERILENSGLTNEAVEEEISLSLDAIGKGELSIYNAFSHKRSNPKEDGVYDSTPAVLEAVRNSFSIASILGTMGGVVVFPRNAAHELQQSRDAATWTRDVLGEEYLNPDEKRR